MFLDMHIGYRKKYSFKFFKVKVMDSVTKFTTHPTRTAYLHLIGKYNLLAISKIMVGKPKDGIVRWSAVFKHNFSLSTNSSL